MYKFLTKPWEDDLLREHIRKAFDLYEMMRENQRLAGEVIHDNEALTIAKNELEMRVDKKTLEAALSGNMLKISQEMLEYLPVGVIGVDDGGMIATANRKAEQTFGTGSLLGMSAAEVLSAEIVACTSNFHGGGTCGPRPYRLPAGGEAEFWCHPMGNRSDSLGTVILLVPKSEDRGQKTEDRM